jgi:hypothetical protein
MNKLVTSMSSFLCASAGWWVGEQIGGIFTAFAISMLGTGIGIYYGKKLVDRWSF